jgi:hypothetical protein
LQPQLYFGDLPFAGFERCRTRVHRVISESEFVRMPCGGPENEFGVGFGMEADRLARRLEHREFACLHGLGNGEASATANPIPARSSGPIDTHSTLEALTQPDLKTRGVAYWQAASPRPGTPCQKIVYIGTMDAKLHAVDADTGKKCEGFADGGVLDINQWNEINAKWPLSVLQPPTVYKDTLFIGWAGQKLVLCAGSSGQCVRRPRAEWRVETDVRRPAPRGCKEDRHGERLGQHVDRPGAWYPLSPGLVAKPEFLKAPTKAGAVQPVKDRSG